MAFRNQIKKNRRILRIYNRNVVEAPDKVSLVYPSKRQINIIIIINYEGKLKLFEQEFLISPWLPHLQYIDLYVCIGLMLKFMLLKFNILKMLESLWQRIF